MQGWIVVGSWATALVFAVIVLGFGIYEVSWKIRRFRSDQAKLGELAGQLSEITSQLQVVSERTRRADRLGEAGVFGGRD